MSPKFLVIHYPRGAAGKFLMSLLMSSNSVAHFDPTAINTNNHIDYIKHSFVSDLSNWLKFEPSDKVAWNLHFISNTYDRGNDLTVEQFYALCKQHASDWFWQSVNDGKYILVPWHKSFIPKYLGDDVISITVDTPSRRWFVRSVWQKHFGIVNGKIHLKENDPNFYQAKNKVHYNYNNQIYSDETVYRFVKNNILKTEEYKYFANTSNLVRSKVLLELVDLLNIDRLNVAINNITQTFNLDEIDPLVIEEGFKHWRNLH